MNSSPSGSVAAPATIPVVLPGEAPVSSGASPPARNAQPVLHVINGEHYSGAERVQDLLAACLPEYGYAVEFACLKPDRFPEARQTASAPLFEFPMQHRFDLRPVWPLIRLIRRRKYRLLHAHTPRSALLASLAAKLTRTPLVYHVHSPTSRDSTRRYRNWFNDLNERFSLGGASRLITVSGSLRRHMCLQGYAEERIRVVPNGVPQSSHLRPDSLPEAPWTIGTVALFRPRKGLEILLDCLSRLRELGHRVELRAVGPFETDEYQASIEARVRDLGLVDQIEWIGFTSDVGSELTKMDLFVLPSLFGEGLPMVMLEAMASGVPIVATRVEGVPEAIDDGVNGLLAQAGDPEDLAGCIRSILKGDLSWPSLAPEWIGPACRNLLGSGDGCRRRGSLR